MRDTEREKDSAREREREREIERETILVGSFTSFNHFLEKTLDMRFRSG